MSRMVVIYNTPADPEAFDRHYFSTHVPLAKQLPGLTRYELSKGPIVGRMTGAAPYMIATLHFASMPQMQQAFASEIGKACAADRRLFAPRDEDSVMFLFEEQTV
jgi:uncharacterized protein (TIGR02118 family)